MRLGAEHRSVLAVRSRAGRALFRLRRYAEAEALHECVRAAQNRLFGADDPDTLDSAQGLQLVLGNLGRRDDALALLRSLVVGRGRALGPAHLWRGKPEVRLPSDDETGGRGLLLVQALAHRWGVEERAGGIGKTVWAELKALDILAGPVESVGPRPAWACMGLDRAAGRSMFSARDSGENTRE
ncbi:MULTISPECIES: tetratricopeptide repeat protein [unclassified Streptomyces]|uniref:tetratricopeptide repeat protein n=1 Tax=unclassified Streptomyces TaxID=2593676 RepID=UPI003324B405